MGFPGGSALKEAACHCRRRKFYPWVGKIPLRRRWQLTPVFLSGEFHRWRQATVHGIARVGHDLATKQPQKYTKIHAEIYLAWEQWVCGMCTCSCYCSHLLGDSLHFSDILGLKGWSWAGAFQSVSAGLESYCEFGSPVVLHQHCWFYVLRVCVAWTFVVLKSGTGGSHEQPAFSENSRSLWGPLFIFPKK